MRWIKQFQLFLFDFDGLLVNTEELHYLAYKRMCAGTGVELTWDFKYYCGLAHYSSDGLKKELYLQFPQFNSIEPRWEVLYAEKKQAIIDLLNEGAVHPMPGVEKLLRALQEANIPRCVVTHSANELVSVCRKKNPILDTIPVWLTREHYSHPKPHPECYLKAIDMLAKPNDKIVGFEDTPRGLKALQQTRAKPVIISLVGYPEISAFKKEGVEHFDSFESIPDNWHC